MAPEPMPLRGRAIGEHCELTRRIVQSGKLESGVGGGALRSLRRQRLGIAALEIGSNGCTTHSVLNDHEAPGLTQSHRRGKTRQMDQPLQSPRGQRIAPEAANIPPPHEQFAQACAKSVVELRGPAAVCGETLALRHASFLMPRDVLTASAAHDPTVAAATNRIVISPTCSSAPNTSPVWPPICRTHSHASNATSAAKSTTARRPPAEPSASSSARTPTTAAAMALTPGGLPTATERPSALAGGRSRMNSAMPERAPICVATRAGAASAGSAMVASALVRSSSEANKAQTP